MSIGQQCYELIYLGGLEALAVGGKAIHWNQNVPGGWVGPYTLVDLGSHVSTFAKINRVFIA